MGLESESSTPVGEAVIHSDVGYHNRPGGHSIEPFDWQKFLEFADDHFTSATVQWWSRTVSLEEAPQISGNRRK
jgi:hypothetical protein